MDILISESRKGTHANVAKLINARLIAFTFRPAIYGMATAIEDIYYDTDIPVSGNDRWFYVEGVPSPYDMLVKEYGKNIVKMIIGLLKQSNGSKIYLAHDLDMSGELMSSMLYYHLVREGVPRDLIVRLALAEIEYINIDEKSGQLTPESEMYLNVGFGEFYSESQLYSILEAIRAEQQMMNGWSKTKAGYRKMFAMSHVESKRTDTDYRIIKLNSGTSYATYLANVGTHYRREYYKQLLDEKKRLKRKKIDK